MADDARAPDDTRVQDSPAAPPAAGEPGAPAPTPPEVASPPEPRDPPMSGPAAVAPQPRADAAAPPAGGPTASNWLEQLTPDQRRALEELSLNLARASVTTQAALATAALTQGSAPGGMEAAAQAANPDPFHAQPALGEVASRLAANPEALLGAQSQLFERYMGLWSATARRMAGEEVAPAVEPAKGDKRFKDPSWTENPVFDVMKQSYLISSEWLNGLVGSVEGTDPMTKRRAEFFTKMVTDAFSPSNFLLSNPAALKQMVDTQGESLVRGAQNFAADLQRGGGTLAISQTDYSKFKVGENVATAPGKVVFQNALFQLIQYAPTTEQVHETPLLIFPPWINKFYIMDLKPENSMIRWLTGQGFSVFLTSWVNPGPELKDHTFEDYMREGAYAAVEAVVRQTGVPQVNAVGYCIGGTLLASTLAHMAANGVPAIGAATFFAAQQDFQEAGDLLLFTDDAWLADLEKKMDAAGGVLPGAAMADTFNMLRGNDLIWSFFVNNYLMGKEPAAFDLLFWNSDQTRMPKTLHMSYLRDFYQGNRLAKKELELGGAPLDLGSVTIPVYVQSSREDHIAPMRSVYRGARLFGGETTFTLAGSGHIAGGDQRARGQQVPALDQPRAAARGGGLARRCGGAQGQLVAALGCVAERALRRQGARPRPRRGPAAGDRGGAGQLREGALRHAGGVRHSSPATETAAMKTVTLDSKIDGFAFTALHAQAQGPRKGGVVLVQEIFGLDAFMRADVERWSGLGFEVYAPSLFDRAEPGFEAEHGPDGIQQGMRYAQGVGIDPPTYDIETCVDELVKRGPAFVVGYCYGGWMAWLAACKIDTLAAASCYYGGMIAADAAAKPLCPVVMHFGGQDAHIPPERIETIRRHQPDLPIHVYETAGHGFNNEGGPQFDRAAADSARKRTLELFAANGAA